MLALPPPTGFSSRVRLPRDYCVRVASNDYSMNPQAIGRFVEVRADLETVRISFEGPKAGTHRRCWGRGQTITDPAHVGAAKVQRQHSRTQPRRRKSPVWMPSFAIWGITTGRSVSPSATARSSHDRGQGDFRADRVLRPGDEGTADPGVGGPSGRPGARGRLVPRGIPGRRAVPGSCGQGSLRGGNPGPGREVTGQEVAGGLQLRPSTRAETGNHRPSGHRRFPGRGRQRGVPGAAGDRENPSGHRARPGGPPSWATASCSPRQRAG